MKKLSMLGALVVLSLALIVPATARQNGSTANKASVVSGAKMKAKGLIVKHDQEVGFDDIEHRQDTVHRRVQDSADRHRFEVDAQSQRHAQRQLLMPEFRTRGHVVHSVNELVPPPIVGKPEEVRVGELARGPAGVVRLLMPGHAAHRSIV